MSNVTPSQPEYSEVGRLLVKICDNSGIIFIFHNNMLWAVIRLIVLGFNDTSSLVGHFVSSPREREKRDSRGDERDD